jgi:AcrR family transcriptional regulator
MLKFLEFPMAARIDTKTKLLNSAEELFIANGIAAVSFREINRAAGQRNASALHYHFSNRERLLEALIDRRMPAVDAKRVELMAICEAAPREAQMRALTEAIVLPLANTVRTREDRLNWVQLHARIYQYDDFDFGRYFADRGYTMGLLTVRRVYGELRPELPQIVRDQRVMFSVRMAVHTLSDWQRGVIPKQSLIPDGDFPSFLSNLLDMIEACLAAPCSDTTRERFAAQGYRRVDDLP